MSINVASSRKRKNKADKLPSMRGFVTVHISQRGNIVQKSWMSN